MIGNGIVRVSVDSKTEVITKAEDISKQSVCRVCEFLNAEPVESIAQIVLLIVQSIDWH